MVEEAGLRNDAIVQKQVYPDAKIMRWIDKDSKGIFVFSLILGVGLTGAAILGFVFDLYSVGVNLRYLQPVADTPMYKLILGSAFLTMAYFSFRNRNRPVREEETDPGLRRHEKRKLKRKRYKKDRNAAGEY